MALTIRTIIINRANKSNVLCLVGFWLLLVAFFDTTGFVVVRAFSSSVTTTKPLRIQQQQRQQLVVAYHQYYCHASNLPQSTSTVLNMLLPPGFGGGGGFGKKKSTSSSSSSSSMEVGIQTAQLLMDKRRRERLKKKLSKEYPFVPDTILESSIELTSKAFTKVAPDTLKKALKPGGMERIRPDLEKVMVNFALEQPIIQSIPMLDRNEKRNLVKLLVTTSLDYVLRDAEMVLSSPEVRLEALEEQMREVKIIMGPAKLFWYRIRHNVPQLTITLTVSMIGLLVYQKRHVPIVAQGLLSSKTLFMQITNFLSIVVGHLWFSLTKLASLMSIVFGRLWFCIGVIWKKAGALVITLKKMMAL